MLKRVRAATLPADAVAPLGWGSKGLKGVVTAVGSGANDAGAVLDRGELERRLLEIGFVEGARVEILHEGAIGGDPIAIRLDDMRVALRRREAESVLIRAEQGAFTRRPRGRAA